MCGGAIISDYIPHRPAGGSKRGHCAADLWPEADLAGASSYPVADHQAGTVRDIFLLSSTCKWNNERERHRLLLF
jgi:hypothetical protein